MIALKIRAYLKRHEMAVYLATLALYLVQVVMRYFGLPYGFNAILLGLMAVIILVLSLPGLRGTVRVLVYLMLAAGITMFAAAGKGLPDFLLALQAMVNLLCVFMIIEIAGFPIAAMDLKPLFRPLVGTIRSPLLLYWVISLSAMILGAVINLAIVPIIYYAIWDTLKEAGIDQHRAMGNTLKRGLALALSWTPLGIMTAMTLEYSGLLWVHMARLTLPLAVLAMLISLLAEKLVSLREKNVPGERRPVVPGPGTVNVSSGKILLPLVIYITCLMTVVIALNTLVGLGMIDTLIISAGLVPLAWFLVRGRLPDLTRRTGEYFELRVPRMGRFFCLFLAAGVFSQGLRTFGLEAVMDRLMLALFEHLGAMGIVMVIILAIMLLSWLGIHPAVSLVLIGQNLNFHSGILPPSHYAAAMVIGGSLGNLTSPVTAVTIMVASYFDRNPFEVGVRWNLLFLIIYLAALTLLLSITV